MAGPADPLRAYVDGMRPFRGGTFRMGDDHPPEGYEVERPAHPVRLSPFRLGAVPVTVALWRSYCTDRGEPMPAPPAWGWIDTHPMVGVSWEAVSGRSGRGGFCAWASARAGVELRLPSEAEWEYAARVGGTARRYPWGDRWDAARLWCDARSTAPVDRVDRRTVDPNGISDMVGNVWEWCLDVYAAYPWQGQTDPVSTGPRSGEVPTGTHRRCVRGGSWMHFNPDYFRCTVRAWERVDLGSADIGFRLAAPGRRLRG